MKQINFTLGLGTETYFACSLVFNGETLVLGGKNEYNQVQFQKLSLIALCLSQSDQKYGHPCIELVELSF